MVLIENPHGTGVRVVEGTKIAQMVLVKSIETTIEGVEEFDDETERGEKGFGSTGG
jgi:dUTP pyrophosphatase